MESYRTLNEVEIGAQVECKALKHRSVKDYEKTKATLIEAYRKTGDKSFDDVDVDPHPATTAWVPGLVHSSSAGDIAGRMVGYLDGRDKYNSAKSAPVKNTTLNILQFILATVTL